METIAIPSLGYRVYVDYGLLSSFGIILHEILPICTVAIVTDSHVAPLYLSQVENTLTSCGYQVISVIIPFGEQSKSMKMLTFLLEQFAVNVLTRSDCVLALGGGVVGDLAGFASGCYLRGIRFIQMPTTLLAAIDASVGGKTAVNLDAGKNLAGLFHQPIAVFFDPMTLQTLPDDCMKDGLAEAVKTAIIGDLELFKIFQNANEMEQIHEVIVRSIQYKANIVAIDPEEQLERKRLNFGHTIGHAIEKASNYVISHGSAVAIGMAYMSRAMEKRGRLSLQDSQTICSVLKRLGLPVSSDFSANVLMECCKNDKKRMGAKISVVVPVRIGCSIIEEIDDDELFQRIVDGQAEDE